MADFYDKLFCIVWMGEESGLEMALPHLGARIPLELGTVVVFDPSLPHGVLRKGERFYCESHFSDKRINACYSMDMPLDKVDVLRAMGIVKYTRLDHHDSRVVSHKLRGKVNVTTGDWLA